MKKILLIIVGIVLAANAAFSQEPADTLKKKAVYERNEFTLSAGKIGYGELVSAFASIFSLGQYKMDDAVFYPIAAFQYIRYVNNRPWNGRFGVGAQVSYQNVGHKSAEQKPMHYITFMPVFKVYMFARSHVGIYEKTGVGITLVSSGTENTKLQVVPAANLTFGVDAGGPRFKGFLEFGGSVQGVLSLGVQYSF